MAYHPGVGVDNLAVGSPHTYKTVFMQSNLTDTIRQNSIDYSENLTYTDYRTFVRYRLS